MSKKIIKFPKPYKTIMALMPAHLRSDFKSVMIGAIIRSEERPVVRGKKAALDDTGI